MGVPTLSVRPRDEAGTLDWMRPGFVTPVCAPQDVRAAVESHLAGAAVDRVDRAAFLLGDAGSVDRVVMLLHERARRGVAQL